MRRARVTVEVRRTRGGAWAVELRGISTAPIVRDRKTDAIAVARHIAKLVPLDQLIIRGRDGTIQNTRTYGRALRRRPRTPGIARARLRIRGASRG